MNRLNGDEYVDAAAELAKGLAEADNLGLVTYSARAMVALEHLCKVFDVSAMDPGPDEDDDDPWSLTWRYGAQFDEMTERAMARYDTEVQARSIGLDPRPLK